MSVTFQEFCHSAAAGKKNTVCFEKSLWLCVNGKMLTATFEADENRFILVSGGKLAID